MPLSEKALWTTNILCCGNSEGRVSLWPVGVCPICAPSLLLASTGAACSLLMLGGASPCKGRAAEPLLQVLRVLCSDSPGPLVKQRWELGATFELQNSESAQTRREGHEFYTFLTGRYSSWSILYYFYFLGEATVG